MEYLADESEARTANLTHFDLELEMADAVFLAAQEVFINMPTSNTALRKVQAGLVTACIRYYASAIDLCLRGNGVEAESLMRTPIECMGYAIVLTKKPELVRQWAAMDELPSVQARNRLFGSQTSHLKHPLLKDASKTYDDFSMFGAHARVQMIDQTMNSQDPKGWHVAHAERDAQHVRLAFGCILFTMRDLVHTTMTKLLLEPPYPPNLLVQAERFEQLRESLGQNRASFIQWAQNPRVTRFYKGQVAAIEMHPIAELRPRTKGGA